ncbi:hypothetical protein [Lysobacter gummosus]|uniref:hypothetical protein n=1 Tax=Lysobacter gummosus TaxID=262324 RepID=UPI00362F5BD1
MQTGLMRKAAWFEVHKRACGTVWLRGVRGRIQQRLRVFRDGCCWRSRKRVAA